MTTLVKLHRKGQMTLPSRLRDAIGVVEGDLIEATVKQGKIVLTPKVVIDRSKFPAADNEYTPAQRKIIDAKLARSEKDLKNGRGYGPFDTADQMIASMKQQLKKRARSKLNSVRSR